MSADTVAREWLERQKADNGDDLLDEGDCRMCGQPAGEGHEPTDPCGIVAGLLDLLIAQQTARETTTFDWLPAVRDRYKAALTRAAKTWPQEVATDTSIVAALKDIPQLLAALETLHRKSQVDDVAFASANSLCVDATMRAEAAERERDEARAQMKENPMTMLTGGADQIIEIDEDGNVSALPDCCVTCDELRARVTALEGALRKAVEVIRIWHSIGVDERSGAGMWELYQQSPEMRHIETALTGGSADTRETTK